MTEAKCLMVALAACFLVAVECRAEPEPVQRDSADAESWLARYDLSGKKPLTFRMSSKLSEISGLAVSSDGRLFAHNDEDPIVYVLSPTNGEIVKRFTVGSGFMEEDFEGIAIKRDTLFLVNSSGDIFVFRETEDRGHADFRLYRTSLSEKNDVEGLEYDPETDCLLLACKEDPGKGFDGHKAVYAFSLRTRKLQPEPRFLIPVIDQKGKKGKKTFRPSGIALHPMAGRIFVISADGRAMIEMDRRGRILGQQDIPSSTNSQPEGIAFLNDGTMLLANDGQGEQGTITIYPLKPR